MLTEQELREKVKALAPWHFCLEFPYGITTGDCTKETTHDKLQHLLKAGVFSRPVYPNVLDLGANSGQISFWFADNKSSIVDAIEFGPKYFPQLELAVEVKGYSNIINPLKIDLHDLPKVVSENKYDLVLFLGTLHHLKPEKHIEILKACKKALFPGGEIVVQTATNLPVDLMLNEAGFVNTRKLDTHWNDRWAFEAIRDPMKTWTD